MDLTNNIDVMQQILMGVGEIPIEHNLEGVFKREKRTRRLRIIEVLPNDQFRCIADFKHLDNKRVYTPKEVICDKEDLISLSANESMFENPEDMVLPGTVGVVSDEDDEEGGTVLAVVPTMGYLEAVELINDNLDLEEVDWESLIDPENEEGWQDPLELAFELEEVESTLADYANRLPE